MVTVLGLSRLGNILVSIVVGVSCSFVFEVLFMIVGQIILMSCRFRLGHCWCVFSKPFVDESLFLHLINVHISDWRFLRLNHFSASDFAPMSFNSFHVPLIDNCNNIFALDFINISENSLITSINKDLFLFWCNSRKAADQEVNATAIYWLSKCFTSSNVKGVDKIIILWGPTWSNWSCFSDGFPEKSVRIQIGFKSQSFNGERIKNMSSEFMLNFVISSIFECIISFQSWCKKSKVLRKFWY